MAYPSPLTVADIEACPDRASFLQLVMPYYQAACSELGIRYPGVCALQCIYETGVPNNIAHSLRANNNMGGLKGGKQPGATQGEKVTDGTGGYYSRFESVDKYIYAAVWNIVNSGYYSDALAATDMESFARNLIRVWVGHDGDAYAPDVINDYYKYGLASYENDGSGAVIGATGAASGSSGGFAGLTFETKPKERKTARVEEGDHEGLKTFYRINMSGAQFIKQVLAPYCKSKETGQSGYRLWFDDAATPDGTKGSTLYFKPDQYTDIENRMSDKLLENIDKTYQFSFGSGPDSSVIDFQPDYSGIVAAVVGGNKVEGNTVDAITNDLISVSYDKDSDPKRPSTGDSLYDESQGTVRIGDSSYEFNEIINKAANLWASMSSYGYTATMTVIGDPWIDVQTVCSIAVYTPQGLPHHSSGIYLITSATDSISGGSFTTTLELIRNAVGIGVNDSGGVDITIGGNTQYVGQASTLMGGTSGGAVSSFSSAVAGAPSAVVASAINWAVGIANDNSHGYSQGTRWGPDYDCSSLVISAYDQAGVPVKNAGASYTGDMRRAFLSCGFQELTGSEYTSSCDKLIAGDVCLNESKHVEMYIGNGQNVGAHSSYEGSGLYGATGDASGREIRVDNWYDDNWNVVLRYAGGTTSTTS